MLNTFGNVMAIVHLVHICTLISYKSKVTPLSVVVICEVNTRILVIPSSNHPLYSHDHDINSGNSSGIRSTSSFSIWFAPISLFRCSAIRSP